MRSYRKYNKEQLSLAVSRSRCWREVILFLNPDNKGYRGSETAVKKTAIKFGIDFTHFPGRKWNLGREFLHNQQLLENYLSNKIPIKSHSLRLRLLKDGVKEKKCECCGLDSWLGNPIPLELHHCDGNPKNNNLINLKIVCPNCHCSLHLKSRCQPPPKQLKQHKRAKNKNRICIKCGKPARFKYCSYECSHLGSRRVLRPSREKLLELIWTKPCLQIARELDLRSSNTIFKWCESYGIEKPPRGYWAKQKARSPNLTA